MALHCAMQHPPSTSLAFALVLAAAAGCGPAPIVRPTAEPAELRDRPDTDVPRGSGDPRQVELYRDTTQLTYKNVSKGHLDVAKLQAKYMMPQGRAHEPAPACGPNPDPLWIKEWPSDAPMSTPAIAAWIQSRLNRSYAPDLDAAYEKYRGAWKAFDDDLSKKRDEALSRKSFYERVTALRAVLDAGMKTAESLPAGKGVRPGMLHTLATTLVGEYDKEKVGWALMSSGTRTGEDLRRGALANLRPWSDDAAEKKHFAALAMTGGAPALVPALPVATGYVTGGSDSAGAPVSSWLRWPGDVDVASAGAFVLKADPALAPRDAKVSVAVVYPSKALEDMKSETKEAILAKASKEEPSLVSVRGLVAAIEPIDGGATRVTLESRDEWIRQECTDSSAPAKGSPTGDARGKASCRVVERRETERRFTVTAKAWPKEVDAGDWVVVSGDLESVASRGTVKKATVDAALTARFVGCFRKGDPLDPKAKDHAEKLYGASQVGSVDCSLATW